MLVIYGNLRFETNEITTYGDTLEGKRMIVGGFSFPIDDKMLAALDRILKPIDLQQYARCQEK